VPSAVTLAISLAQVIEDLGYAGLTLLMLAETVFPPVPSEAVLPLAGYLVEQGQLNLGVVLATSTAGSVAGAMVLYEAARHGGRPFAERFLRFARLDPARLAEAEAWFARRGALVVLLGRCVPGVRSLVSLPAGLLRMGRLRYLALTLAGSLVWNTVLIAAGYLLGSTGCTPTGSSAPPEPSSRKWERVSEVVGSLSVPVVALVACAAVGFVVWRTRVAARRSSVPAR